MRSSNNEGSAWVKDIPGIDEPLFRDGYLDNLVEKIFSNFLVGDIRVVLARDKDSVNTFRLHGNSFMCILNGDLNFGVRPHPRDYFFFTALLNSADKFSGKVMR